MKKFVFSLQTLLQITAAQEKEQKSILAGINHEINHINSLLDKNMADINSAQKELVTSAELYGFTRYNNYISYLRRRREQLFYELAQKELERDEAQQKLIELMTSRKSYEKLREKKFEEYKKEVQAEEAKYLDDYMSGKR